MDAIWSRRCADNSSRVHARFWKRLCSTIVGAQVISLHTDMSTKTGERMIILVVDTDLDKKFPPNKAKR